MTTVTRGTLEQIKIYNREAFWTWAHFALDNKRGEINIHSDYGDWAYTWSAMGKGVTLKEFLIKCDNGYLMSKLNHGRPNHFDHAATIQQIKYHIIEKRKEDSIDKDMARECYDELEYIEEYWMGDHTSFYMGLENDGKQIIDFIYNQDYSEIPIVNDYTPGLKNFMKYVWPEFIEVIKQDVAGYIKKPEFSIAEMKSTALDPVYIQNYTRKKKQHKCNCDMNVIVSQGCQCGGI